MLRKALSSWKQPTWGNPVKESLLLQCQPLGHQGDSPQVHLSLLMLIHRANVARDTDNTNVSAAPGLPSAEGR